jgi:hypothetical protein
MGEKGRMQGRNKERDEGNEYRKEVKRKETKNGRKHKTQWNI